MALTFAQQTFIGWPASQVNWRPTRFPVQARNRRLRLSPNWTRIDPDRLEIATRILSNSPALSIGIGREPKAHWSTLVAI